jgi:hypothetical protein
VGFFNNFLQLPQFGLDTTLAFELSHWWRFGDDY